MSSSFSSPAHARDGTHAPLTLHLVGNLLTFRARSVDTGGQFSLVEMCTAPGQGAPLHVQTDTEAFLVLEGSYEFRVGEETRHCGPGSFLHVPAGTVHGFSNIAATPARMLIISLPGGPHEQFYLDAADPVAAGTTEFPPITSPDLDRLMAAATRVGMTLLPPAG